MDTKKTLIVVAGPTAVGKTAVAIKLARALHTDVISADSRQFFREMVIGTAKPSPQEMMEVKHHFINSHSINDHYDAAAFAKDALDLINTLYQHKNYAILCGGSGLYIKALCEGFDEIPEVADDIRHQLISEYEIKGIAWLQTKIMELDPEIVSEIDMQNTQRLIRALEVRIGTGQSIRDFRKNQKAQHGFEIRKIGLDLPREVLFNRIDQRMDQMIEAGLFEEAEKLLPWKEKNALQTVGYQEIFDYLAGFYDRNEAIRLLKRNSRRYAKRQLTWFKRDAAFRWFHPDDFAQILNYAIGDETNN